MRIEVAADAGRGSRAAAERLAARLAGARTFLAAAGNTPIDCYREVASRSPAWPRLEVFALDEYVGVPPDHPRTCGNLLRKAVGEAWRLDAARFHAVSPVPEEAEASVRDHERKIEAAGGIDVAVLGLGRNGHLGFNEPGSARDSGARVVDLETVSVEANRRWFGGEHAPARGATLGLRTILSARTVLLLAFGSAKAAAARAMTQGPVSAACPASWLRDHPDAVVFLDREAAGS